MMWAYSTMAQSTTRAIGPALISVWVRLLAVSTLSDNKSKQVVHTRVPLLPDSLNLYWHLSQLNPRHSASWHQLPGTLCLPLQKVRLPSPLSSKIWKLLHTTRSNISSTAGRSDSNYSTDSAVSLIKCFWHRHWRWRSSTRHHPKLKDRIHRTSVLHGMPVYLSALASTNLYCLVTEAHGCEQPAYSCYPSSTRPGTELATKQSDILLLHRHKYLTILMKVHWRHLSSLILIPMTHTQEIDSSLSARETCMSDTLSWSSFL